MNVLAVGCHPDDLEIGCGGTLAKYAKLGHSVFMCHVANGTMGLAVIMPDEWSRSDQRKLKIRKMRGALEVFNLDVLI